MRTPERIAGQDREDGGEPVFLHTAPPFPSVSERRTNKRTAVPSAETSTTPRPGKEDAEEDPSTGPEERVDSIVSFMPPPFCNRRAERTTKKSPLRYRVQTPDGPNGIRTWAKTMFQATATPFRNTHSLRCIPIPTATKQARFCCREGGNHPIAIKNI